MEAVLRVGMVRRVIDVLFDAMKVVAGANVFEGEYGNDLLRVAENAHRRLQFEGLLHRIPGEGFRWDGHEHVAKIAKVLVDGDRSIGNVDRERCLLEEKE